MTLNIYSLQEVFTYSSPAINAYVERIRINRQFNRAITVPGMQIILFGHSGTGKTTLLCNKFREHSIDAITTQCITDTTLNELLHDALNQLKASYISSSVKKHGNNINGEISSSFGVLKAKAKASSSEEQCKNEQRIVDVPITPQTIANYLGEAGKCWVIEDFHKMDKGERIKLTQMMKVTMDASVKYEKIKIIAVGAINSAREALQFNNELKNRVSEIAVPLMSVEELERILTKGAELLNIKFPEKAKKQIINYSCGLPGVVHRLAYLFCECNSIESTHKSNVPYPLEYKYFSEAIEAYLLEEADSYRSKFEITTRNNHKRKFNNPIDILKAILLSDRTEVSLDEIKRILHKFDKNNNGTNLKKYVEELMTDQRGSVLQFNHDSKRYFFSDPLFQVYCKCELRTDSEYTQKLRTAVTEIEREDLKVAEQAFWEDYIREMETFDEDAYLMNQNKSLRRMN